MVEQGAGWVARWRERRASRPEFVRASNARVWRITAVAVIAIVALGFALVGLLDKRHPGRLPAVRTTTTETVGETMTATATETSPGSVRTRTIVRPGPSTTVTAHGFTATRTATRTATVTASRTRAGPTVTRTVTRPLLCLPAPCPTENP